MAEKDISKIGGLMSKKAVFKRKRQELEDQIEYIEKNINNVKLRIRQVKSDNN
jgi:hypothetical protein